MDDKKKYYALFTLVFSVIIVDIYSRFWFAGRTLIWKSDGWNQYYKGLIYYSEYLREIINNLLLGNGLIIPSWDYNLGEGADILTTLHYYGIGDPFLVFSILCPQKYLYIYYDLTIIAKLYLSGISFSCLCFYFINQGIPVLAGTIAYVFCGWNIVHSIRYPSFIGPMIFFPLVILGIEKMAQSQILCDG